MRNINKLGARLCLKPYRRGSQGTLELYYEAEKQPGSLIQEQDEGLYVMDKGKNGGNYDVTIIILIAHLLRLLILKTH